MELRQLRYFITVVNEGSFTRAAEKLYMAQSPLSRQIHQLEEQLDVLLLHRRTRPLQPTDAGRFFYEHALYVLDRVEVLATMTKRLGKLQQGRFGIGFVGSTLYGPLPGLVRRFRTIHPELIVELLELTTLQQVDALKDGRIDVGFGRLYLEVPTVKQETLREEPLVVAIPIGHPLLDRTRLLQMQDLADEPLILYPKEPRPSYADHVLSLYRDCGLEAKATHEVSQLQTALGLVAAAEGICLVPESVQRLRRDDIMYRGLDEPRATSPIIMACRLHDSSREIIAILDLIRELYHREKAILP